MLHDDKCILYQFNDKTPFSLKYQLIRTFQCDHYTVMHWRAHLRIIDKKHLAVKLGA